MCVWERGRDGKELQKKYSTIRPNKFLTIPTSDLLIFDLSVAWLSTSLTYKWFVPMMLWSTNGLIFHLFVLSVVRSLFWFWTVALLICAHSPLRDEAGWGLLISMKGKSQCYSLQRHAIQMLYFQLLREHYNEERKDMAERSKCV